MLKRQSSTIEDMSSDTDSHGGPESVQRARSRTFFETTTADRFKKHAIPATLANVQENYKSKSERELRFFRFRMEMLLYQAENPKHKQPDNDMGHMVSFLRQRVHDALDRIDKQHVQFPSTLQRITFKLCEMLLTKLTYDGAELCIFDLIVQDLCEKVLEPEISLPLEQLANMIHDNGNIITFDDPDRSQTFWTFAETARLIEITFFFSYQRVMPYPRFAMMLSRRLAEAIFHRFWDGEGTEPVPDLDENEEDLQERIDFFLIYRLLSHMRFPLHVASYVSIAFRRYGKEILLEKLYGADTEDASNYAYQLAEFCDLFILRVSQQVLAEIQAPSFERKRPDVNEHNIRTVFVRRRFLLQPDPNGETVFALALKSENIALTKRLLSLVGLPARALKSETGNTDGDKDPVQHAVDLMTGKRGIFGSRMMKYLWFDQEFVDKLMYEDEVSVLLLQRNRLFASPMGPCDDRNGRSEKEVLQTRIQPFSSFEEYAIAIQGAPHQNEGHQNPKTLVEIHFGNFLNLATEDQVVTHKDDQKVQKLWKLMHSGPAQMESFPRIMSMYELMTTISDDALTEVFRHHNLRDDGFKKRHAENFLMNSAFTRQVFLFVCFFVVQIAAPQIVHFTARNLYPDTTSIVLKLMALFMILYSFGVFRVFMDKNKYSVRRSDAHRMASVYSVEPMIADTHSVVDLWQIWIFIVGFVLSVASLVFTFGVFADSSFGFEWGLHLLSIGHLLGIFLFVDFYLNAATVSALAQPRSRGVFTELGRRVLALVSRRLVSKREKTATVLQKVFKNNRTEIKFFGRIARYIAFAARSALFVPLRIMYMIEAVLLDTLKFVVFLFLCTLLSGIALSNVYGLASMQDPLPWEAEQSLTTTSSSTTTLFFAMFGLVEVDVFHATPFYRFNGNYDQGTRWGYVIFGFYLSVVVILLLNLLISLMVRSAEIVNERLPAKILRRGIRTVFTSSRMPGTSAAFGPLLAINIWTAIVLRIRRWFGYNPDHQNSERISDFAYYNNYYGPFYHKCLVASMTNMWTRRWTPDKFFTDEEEKPSIEVIKDPDWRLGSVHYAGVKIFNRKVAA